MRATRAAGILAGIAFACALVVTAWSLGHAADAVALAPATGNPSPLGPTSWPKAPDPPESARQPVRTVSGRGATVRFTGRCVHASGRAPLPSVAVRLAVWPAVRARKGQIGTPLSDVRATTDTQGRFEVESPIAGDHILQLFFEREGFCVRRARWQGLAAGDHQVLPDVELHPGAQLRGIVLTEDGTPLPAGYVAMATRGAGVAGNRPEPEKHAVEPDHQGRFCLGGLPAGEHRIEASFAGYANPSPTVVNVAPDLAPIPAVRILLRRLPAVAGVVVDRAGRPVAGVDVEFALPPGMHAGDRIALLQRTESQADGSFHLCGPLNPRMSSVALQAWAEGYREGRTAEIPWGTRDVRIVLDPATRLRVRAAERTTHAPVETFGVRLWRADRPVADVARAPRLAGTHPAGLLEIGHLSVARYWLAVEAPGFAASTPQVVTVTEQPDEVLVLLDRPGHMVVELLDAAGDAARDTVLELMLGTRQQALHVTSTFDDMLRNPIQTARVLAKTSTDSKGCATFGDLPPCTVHVRCRDPRRPFLCAGPFQVAAGEGTNLTVRLPPECQVMLHIAPASVATCLAGAQLVSSEEPTLLVPRVTPVPVAADGTLVFAAVPQGRWQVRLLRRVRDHGTGTDVPVPFDLDLPVLDLSRMMLEVDASALLPRPTRVRVVQDGQPVAGGSRFHAQGERGGRQWRSAPASADSGGVVAFDDLIPGRYQLVLPDGTRSEPWSVPAPGGEVAVAIPAGGR